MPCANGDSRKYENPNGVACLLQVKNLYCGQVSPVLYLSLLYNLRTEISTLFYLAYRLVSHAGT